MKTIELTKEQVDRYSRVMLPGDKLILMQIGETFIPTISSPRCREDRIYMVSSGEQLEQMLAPLKDEE